MNIRFFKFLFLFLIINTSFAKEWSFIVMSDIHIYPSGRIPEKFVKMVEHVLSKKPEIVFITGDHTNGNRGDRYDAERISFWYDQLDKALKPLYDAGIIVVPTVGNHDFYELKHQEGYKNWATKTECGCSSKFNSG